MLAYDLPSKPNTSGKGLDRNKPFPRRGAEFDPHHNTKTGRPSSPSLWKSYSIRSLYPSPSPSTQIPPSTSAAISTHMHQELAPSRLGTPNQISFAEQVSRLDTSRGDNAMDSRAGFGRRGTLRFAGPALRAASPDRHHYPSPSTISGVHNDRVLYESCIHGREPTAPTAASRYESERDGSPDPAALNHGSSSYSPSSWATYRKLKLPSLEAAAPTGFAAHHKRDGKMLAQATKLPNIGKKRSPTPERPFSVIESSDNRPANAPAEMRAEDIAVRNQEHERNAGRGGSPKLSPQAVSDPVGPASNDSTSSTQQTLEPTAIAAEEVTSLIDAVILEHRGTLAEVIANLQSAGLVVAEVRNLPGSFKRAVVVTKRATVAPMLAEQLSADASPLEFVKWAPEETKDGEEHSSGEVSEVDCVRRRSQGMADLIKLVQEAAEELSCNFPNNPDLDTPTAISANVFPGAHSQDVSESESGMDEASTPRARSIDPGSPSPAPSVTDTAVSPTTVPVQHLHRKTSQAKSIYSIFSTAKLSLNPITDKIKRWKTGLQGSSGAESLTLNQELWMAEQLEAERYPDGEGEHRAWHSSQVFASTSTLQDPLSIYDVSLDESVASLDSDVILASYKALPSPPHSDEDRTPTTSPALSSSLSPKQQPSGDVTLTAPLTPLDMPGAFRTVDYSPPQPSSGYKYARSLPDRGLPSSPITDRLKHKPVHRHEPTLHHLRDPHIELQSTRSLSTRNSPSGDHPPFLPRTSEPPIPTLRTKHPGQESTTSISAMKQLRQHCLP